MADEYTCPITFELPITPVIAMDGKTYERSAIEKWLIEKRMSPSTNLPMAKKLIPATQVRNAIEALVKSAVIAGEKADVSKAKLEDEEKVKKWREEAEGGDADACTGSVTLTVGAKSVFRRISSKPACGMCAERISVAQTAWRSSASISLRVSEVPKTRPLGFFYVTQAEKEGTLGLPTLVLGRGFAKGRYGLPVDHVQAQLWLTKCINFNTNETNTRLAKEQLDKLPAENA